MVVPGVKGTTTVINRDGYCSCAAAAAQTAIAVASTNAAKLARFIWLSLRRISKRFGIKAEPRLAPEMPPRR